MTALPVTGRMPLKEHKAKLRELLKESTLKGGGVSNPHQYGTRAGVTTVHASSASQESWIGYAAGVKYRLKCAPVGFAPFAVRGMRCWVPVPPEEAETPCGKSVRGGDGRWPSFHPCDMPRVEGGEKCKAHTTVAVKNAAKDDAWKEREERSKAGSQIAQDAVTTLTEFGVEGKVHYHVPFGSGMGKYTGEVEIHAEDLLALLREVRELRELKGEM